jgi:AcrR family transcriptional regulator
VILTIRPRPRTQRERLLDMMIALVGQHGCPPVTMSQLCSQAGISRATFYECFQGKEECMLAAYGTAAARLFAAVPSLKDAGDWQPALRTALSALLEALREDPDAGRVVFVEALAGGPLVRAQARGTQQRCARELEALFETAGRRSAVPDIPVHALVGGVHAMAARYLRTNSEERLPLLLENLLDWISSYVVLPGAPRWTSSPHLLPPLPPSRALAASVAAPADRPAFLPKGRHRLPAGVVLRVQRARIIGGTAKVVSERGYADATVSDIVAASHVARDVFYKSFANKQEAFLAAQQHGTARLVDACAGAYFAAERWPERVWSVLATLTDAIAANPALSYLRIVECYTAGRAAIADTERLVREMRIFLHEGYGYAPHARALPALCSEAIVASIFQMIQRALLEGEAASLPRRVPDLAFVAIAPFVGPQHAAELLEALIAKTSSSNAVAAARG